MEFKKYQEVAMSTKVYGVGESIIYPSLKLNGEAGEVAEKVGKVLRDKQGYFTTSDKDEIAKELGDVLWYITAVAEDIGYTLQEVAELNLVKVLDRRDRNVIHGNGDNR
jgi:NTP pyrophosphatase (non-canonical NTP hydrolase)